MFSIQAVQFEYAQIFILALGVVHTAIGIVQPTTGKRITFSTEFLGVFYVFFFFLNLLLSCRDTFLIILLAEGVTLLTLVMIVVSTSLKSFRTVPSIINYFLINIVLAAILVFAALQMYTITGYTSISAIHYFLSTSNSDCSLWISLFFGALLFKIGVFPFYFFFVDLYSRLPWVVFAALNYVYKVMIFLFLCYFWMDFSTYINSNVVTAIGLFSILIGALGVYKTLNLRIILVYSSLFNMGFALVLLSFGFVPLAFSYFLVYCIFSFLLVFFLIDLDCDTSIVWVYDIKNPVNAVIFSFLFLVLSGLPPFIFFYFKLNAFLAFSSLFHYFWLFFIVVNSTLITVAYFKVMRYLYFELKLKEHWPFYVPVFIFGVGSSFFCSIYLVNLLLHVF